MQQCGSMIVLNSLWTTMEDYGTEEKIIPLVRQELLVESIRLFMQFVDDNKKQNITILIL